MKVIIDGKEYVEKSKVEDLIYSGYFEGMQETFERIEQALGFKLFTWQKSYIAVGELRRCGKTTAECLRILLEVDAEPLDLTRPAGNARGEWFRRTLKEIQEKLVSAGIPTRTIFWNYADKNRYRYERECMCKWMI